MKKGISYIIPCYNEQPSVLQETIDSLKNSLIRSKIPFEILVINDFSAKYNYDGIKNAQIIDHKVNRGYGASIKTGIQNSKFDWIGITDADGTYPNHIVDTFVPYMDDYDMIVGSRSIKDISIMRRFPKAVLNQLASFLANSKIPDLNSGLRIFKKDIALKYWGLFPDRFSYTSTITMVCLNNGYFVKYLPIDYYTRKGKSSIHPIKDTIRFFALVMRLTVYFNPQRFFVPLGLILSVLAVARTIRDILLVAHIGNLSIVLFFLAMQTFFFGLLADLIIKRTKIS